MAGLTPRQLCSALALAAALWAAPVAAETFQDAMAAYQSGDSGQAARIFTDLAQGGEPAAQFNLALLYLTGDGLPQNFREAYHWAWRARLNGLAEADAVLSRVAPDITDAMRREVATQIEAELQPQIAAGEGRAMLALSIVYAQMLPQPDQQGAYVWQSLAAALGTAGAAGLRDATWAALPTAKRLPAQDAAQAKFAEWCGAATVPFAACATQGN